MSLKRSRATTLRAIAATGSSLRTPSFGTEASPVSAARRRVQSRKHAGGANRYICAIERNQNGRYNVRIQALLGAEGRGGWTLAVYFLASSFNAGMKKLEESLQHLQKNEEQLRFWAVERTDDPNLAGDLWLLRCWPERGASWRSRSPRSVPPTPTPTPWQATEECLPLGCRVTEACGMKRARSASADAPTVA